jgi:hypothetical protein
MNLDGYKDWLVSEGYQPSTVDTTVRKLTRLFHFAAERTNGHARPHLQRYLRYVKDTKRSPLGQEFQAALVKEGFRASSKRSKPGARNKKLLTASQLTELRSKLRTRGTVGRIAALYMQSKLNVSMFLVLERAEVLKLDGVDAGWFNTLFREERATCIWQTFAESRRAAYIKLLDLVRAEGTDLDTIYRSKVQQV